MSDDAATTSTPPAAPAELCQQVCAQASPVVQVLAFVAAVAWGAWQQSRARHWKAVSMRPAARPVIYTAQVPPLPHLGPFAPSQGAQSLEPPAYRRSEPERSELEQLELSERHTPPERPKGRR